MFSRIPSQENTTVLSEDELLCFLTESVPIFYYSRVVKGEVPFLAMKEIAKVEEIPTHMSTEEVLRYEDTEEFFRQARKKIDTNGSSV